MKVWISDKFCVYEYDLPGGEEYSIKQVYEAIINTLQIKRVNGKAFTIEKDGSLKELRRK